MVNATVDNDPVSVLIGPNQSTTVPTNETWRVSIYLSGRNFTEMVIDGIPPHFVADSSAESGEGVLTDVTLVGGQKIAEVGGVDETGIFITGFVVNS
jgi:hypothetical protein